MNNNRGELCYCACVCGIVSKRRPPGHSSLFLPLPAKQCSAGRRMPRCSRAPKSLGSSVGESTFRWHYGFASSPAAAVGLILIKCFEILWFFYWWWLELYLCSDVSTCIGAYCLRNTGDFVDVLFLSSRLYFEFLNLFTSSWLFASW